jgi:hypothetical protein
MSARRNRVRGRRTGGRRHVPRGTPPQLARQRVHPRVADRRVDAVIAQVIKRLNQAAGVRGQVGDGFGERVRRVMFGRGSLRGTAPGAGSLCWGVLLVTLAAGPCPAEAAFAGPCPARGCPSPGVPVSAASRDPVMPTPTRYQAIGRADGGPWGLRQAAGAAPMRRAMAGSRRSLSRQRLRLGPMLPIGMPSRALISA